MPKQPMSGRICLVTGASSGLGRATAHSLAENGAHVLLVCRDKNRGKAARDEMIESSGNSKVDLLIADLASQASIRKLATNVREQYARLDVLINNAAIVCKRRVTTEDGYETQFAVNYLAQFMLTNLLLDCLHSSVRESGSARVVNVASVAHYRGRINFDDLNGERHYFGLRAYRQSKLATVVFTFELARRLAGTGITVNCLDPGLVRTAIGEKNVGPVSRLVWKAAKRLFKSPERGAETILYLACAPDVENITGQYFVNRRETPPSPLARDESHARRLWKVSEEFTVSGSC